jgi:hypothetical protein
MEVTIKVDTEKLKRRVDAYLKFPQDVLQVAGQTMFDYLVDYHSQMDWKEDRWFPGTKSGQFAQKVVDGWQPPVISGKTVSVTNTFGLLDWKKRGGVISPQRARWLTIPLVGQAKGISVAEFEATSGNRLFKAGRALCIRIGKKIQAVYALSPSVRQFPKAGAMPRKEEIERAVGQSIRTFVKSL